MSKRYPGGILRKTPQTPTQTSAQGIWDMASVTQAVKENTWPIAGVPDPISKSLRFRSSASAYLNRTPASAGNRRTWTWSAWVKRGDLTDFNMLFGATSSTSDAIGFRSSGTGLYPSSIYFYLDDLTGGGVYTNAVFRDPSAWYHIVLAVDTTQATSSNRIKLYINGTQQTFVSATYPTQNYDCRINNNVLHNIGAVNGATFLSGYLAEVNFIDGQALTPSSFGSTNDQTGVWQPIAYTGTYGTNGFYLPFSNTASTTTLGYDFSGNSNNWTTNNISLTSGTTYDSMVDVPTQWIPYNTAGDTGALWRGNYCVLNPLSKGANVSATNGNLNAVISGGSAESLQSTLGMASGKWYCEMTAGGGGSIFGITTVGANLSSWVGSDTKGYGYRGDTGAVMYNSSALVSGMSTFASGDVISLAFDADAGKLWFAKNGTWYNSGSPSAGTNATVSSIASGTWFVSVGRIAATNDAQFNFGQRPFSYTPPSGFKTLNTTNLPTPTIGATASTQAITYMGATTYSGDSTSNRVITTGGGSDFVWIKRRNSSTNNILFDVIRGAGATLYSNLTTTEAANGTYYVQVFGNTSFTLGTGGDAADNITGGTYVAWNWKANGAGVTNTAGSITSTVSANTTAGFSIVTINSPGSSTFTFGHGLGVAPKMMIVKSRTTVTSWLVYHASATTTTSQYLVLNSTAATATVTNIWGTALPTSSVAGGLGNQWGLGTDNYVVYCFAEVAGYSAFGSYTGNGSTDGTFVYTGFRPRYLMIKRTDSSNNWVIQDTSRDTYNVSEKDLYADTSGAEATYAAEKTDILSNGFKQRQTGASMNASGGTYIYIAFAESPFKYALAR